eukprot:3219191-Amphidinium_carterae.2
MRVLHVLLVDVPPLVDELVVLVHVVGFVDLLHLVLASQVRQSCLCTAGCLELPVPRNILLDVVLHVLLLHVLLLVVPVVSCLVVLCDDKDVVSPSVLLLVLAVAVEVAAFVP